MKKKKWLNSKIIFTITMVFVVCCFILTSLWAAKKIDFRSANAKVQDENDSLTWDEGFTLLRQGTEVTVPQPPIADFTASSTNICECQSVTFTDTSVNNPTSWSWTFEGGNPSGSTDQNPTDITYDAAGIYDVSLTVTNAAGSDGETKIDYITVRKCPIYCTSSGNNQSYEYIARVEVADLDNSSGSDGGYGDYTHLTAHLTQGKTIKVSLTPGFTGGPYTEYWKIWIDFDLDGDFEDEDVCEEVFRGSGNSVLTGSISVPCRTITGETRMRVSMSYNIYPPMCGTFTYGEVEDYTVNIASSPGAETCTVGYTDVFPNTALSDTMCAQPFTMPEDGIITSVTMCHTSGSGSVIFSVYDGEGTPQNRLAITPPTPVSGATGWQTVNLTSPVCVPRCTPIWLAWCYSGNVGIFYETDNPGSKCVEEGCDDKSWTKTTPYNYSIFATYTPSDCPPYTLTVKVVGNGTVTLNPPGGTYDAGTVVNLTIEPDPGWKLGCIIDELGNPVPLTIIMNSDKTVTAVFAKEGWEMVGNTDVFASTSTSPNLRAMPFIMPENGTITSVTIYHNGGNGDMSLGVYDGKDAPQNRLARTSPTAVSISTGWQTINLISPPYVPCGKTIWLAWCFYGSNPGVRYKIGTPGRADSGEPCNGLPDPFGCSTQANYIYSIYATYMED